MHPLSSIDHSTFPEALMVKRTEFHHGEISEEDY
jgi:hypothetical protein